MMRFETYSPNAKDYSNMLSHVEKLNHSEFISAFLNQEHRGRNRSFYGCDDRYIYGSLFCVLKEILN
jgi:hypothetical protein